MILSHQSPSHCQCVGVGGCDCICHLRSDTVGAVITEHYAIPPPGDRGGRPTSGGAGEGEHRRVSGWVCVQLEGDFTWDSNLPCWRYEYHTKCCNSNHFKIGGEDPSHICG